jgi:hypothetical protein
MLRQSCGYSLVTRGVDIRGIQGYLGHRAISSTVRYTALDAKGSRNFFGGLLSFANRLNSNKGTKSDFGPHPAKLDEAQVILAVNERVS